MDISVKTCSVVVSLRGKWFSQSSIPCFAIGLVTHAPILAIIMFRFLGLVTRRTGPHILLWKYILTINGFSPSTPTGLPTYFPGSDNFHPRRPRFGACTVYCRTLFVSKHLTKRQWIESISIRMLKTNYRITGPNYGHWPNSGHFFSSHLTQKYRPSCHYFILFRKKWTKDMNSILCLSIFRFV